MEIENLNNETSSLTALYKDISRRPEVRALIPMGYTPGMPILSVRNDQLIAIIPFLRYKITGETDRTLIFPIRYVMEYLVPENQPVGFADLALTPLFADENFDKVIGFFRHEAVRHLDCNQYRQLRHNTVALYDKLIKSLTTDAPYTPADDVCLINNLKMIVEPSVAPYYKRLDSDFYNRYLK